MTKTLNMGSQLRWLERTPDKREVDGSIPFEPTKLTCKSQDSTLKNIQKKEKYQGKLEYSLSKDNNITIEPEIIKRQC